MTRVGRNSSPKSAENQIPPFFFLCNEFSLFFLSLMWPSVTTTLTIGLTTIKSTNPTPHQRQSSHRELLSLLYKLFFFFFLLCHPSPAPLLQPLAARHHSRLDHHRSRQPAPLPLLLSNVHAVNIGSSQLWPHPNGQARPDPKKEKKKRYVGLRSGQHFLG